MTQGATQSFMSVPAASVRIKNVEARLGDKLLHRTSRGVSLTPMGEAFLRHGKILLRQVELMQADLRGYANGVKGRMQILASVGALPEFLPGALFDFLAAHREFVVEIREFPSQEIGRGVNEGTAEMGIVPGGVSAKDLNGFLPSIRGEGGGPKHR